MILEFKSPCFQCGDCRQDYRSEKQDKNGVFPVHCAGCKKWIGNWKPRAGKKVNHNQWREDYKKWLAKNPMKREADFN